MKTNTVAWKEKIFTSKILLAYNKVEVKERERDNNNNSNSMQY